MKKRNEITNTKAHMDADPLIRMMSLPFFGGSSESIEASEKQGQQQLVKSDVLPVDMNPKDRAALESFGVVFGDPVPGDNLFVYATLPAGWKKVPTNHDMWSDLVDERGRKRAGIFYKAAFYDRKARLSLDARFSIEMDWSDEKDQHPNENRCMVKDQGKVIFDTGWVAKPNDPNVYGDEILRKQAETWLSERYPDFKNPAAYWEET